MPQKTTQSTSTLNLTLKAFANFSPELERSDNSGIQITKQESTLKEFVSSRTLSRFQAFIIFASPELSLRSQLRAGISKRLRRFDQGS
jgi:hypothetical protein